MPNVFDKEKYWKRRLHTVNKLDEEGKPVKKNGKNIKVPKPLRGQDIPSRIINTEPSEASVGFANDGHMVVLNRDYRRQKYKLPDTEPKPKKKRQNKPKTFGINKRKKK